MRSLAVQSVSPGTCTMDGGEGRVDESVGCSMLKASVARGNDVGNIGSGWTRPVGEETHNGCVNMADNGSSLQGDNCFRKDEDNGCCLGMWLIGVAKGSRLVLAGLPSKRAFVRGEHGQVD